MLWTLKSTLNNLPPWWQRIDDNPKWQDGAFIGLAACYGLIALVAVVQLIRIQRRVPEYGWTTQKVSWWIHRSYRSAGHCFAMCHAAKALLVALPMRRLHGHSSCASLSQLLNVLCCLLLAACWFYCLILCWYCQACTIALSAACTVK